MAVNKFIFLSLLFSLLIALGQANTHQTEQRLHGHHKIDDNELISTCVQQKLKLPSQVQNKVFKEDENYKKLAFSYRLASRLCSDRYEQMSTMLYEKLTKPSDRSKFTATLDDVTIKCYQVNIIKSRPNAPLIQVLDKSLLNGFDGSDRCTEIVDDAKKKFRDETPTNKTPEELACVDSIIDDFSIHRFIPAVIFHGNYDDAIVNEEKKLFSDNLRVVTDKIIDCFVSVLG